MSGTGIIIGRASCVFEDFARAHQIIANYDVHIVINRIGREWGPKFDHWVSYHPDQFTIWIAERARKGLPPISEDVKFWSGIYRGKRLGEKTAKVKLNHCNISGGSSGLLAAHVALKELALDKVVLCGCPMEDTPRYDDARTWTESQYYRKQWDDHKPFLANRLKSMSGWTRGTFGTPTREWLTT